VTTSTLLTHGLCSLAVDEAHEGDAGEFDRLPWHAHEHDVRMTTQADDSPSPPRPSRSAPDRERGLASTSVLLPLHDMDRGASSLLDSYLANAARS
jgi:hypothetical protein